MLSAVIRQIKEDMENYEALERYNRVLTESPHWLLQHAEDFIEVLKGVDLCHRFFITNFDYRQSDFYAKKFEVLKNKCLILVMA